jgi:hypothetical protein
MGWDPTLHKGARNGRLGVNGFTPRRREASISLHAGLVEIAARIVRHRRYVFKPVEVAVIRALFAEILSREPLGSGHSASGVEHEKGLRQLSQARFFGSRW